MSIVITIGGVDKTSLIDFGTVIKIDAINNIVDTLMFRLLSHAGQTYLPSVNEEVIMTDDGETVFGGYITKIDKQVLGQGTAEATITCSDYSCRLTAETVNEQYLDMTVKEIIDALVADHDCGITSNQVVCDVLISKIIFNRQTFADCVQRLADVTGYSWYVDYDKDIHFFIKNSELAPFNVSDGDGNTITDSLKISTDLSQIRNRVFVKGGEVEGLERTEYFDGDGNSTHFRLANKFSELPVVEVGGSPVTVGVDFLDSLDDFDCLWSYQQKYLIFGTAPSIGVNQVAVTGKPLYTICIQVEDHDSIATYGLNEFAKIDERVRSRDEAVSLAKAEITSYRNGLISGSFATYTSGLRSGQVIRVNSTLLNVSETFVIQSVRYSMVSPTQGLWNVTLATLKSLDLIDVLLSLLKGKSVDSLEEILEKTEFPEEIFSITESVSVAVGELVGDETIEITEVATAQALDYPVEWVLGPQVPDGYKRVFILDGSFLT